MRARGMRSRSAQSCLEDVYGRAEERLGDEDGLKRQHLPDVHLVLSVVGTHATRAHPNIGGAHGFGVLVQAGDVGRGKDFAVGVVGQLEHDKLAGEHDEEPVNHQIALPNRHTTLHRLHPNSSMLHRIQHDATQYSMLQRNTA